MSANHVHSQPLLLAGILALVAVAPLPAQERKERVLHFDFPALHIGVAEYDEGPTGTTVFYFPEGVIAAADVRGGSPGTVNVPAVTLGYEEPWIDAVVFSGGSSYGLSAATGVANEIKALERKQGKDHIAGVLGAIIYDIGGRRPTRITPDAALGAAALRVAETNLFPLGARGAGRMAMQGAWFHLGQSAKGWSRWARSGQGGAFRQVGTTKIAVFTVVNSLGTIVDREGRVVRCHRNDPSAECPMISDHIVSTLERRAQPLPSPDGPTSNTTLTLVVTNQKMPFADLQRLAVQVHTSMARAIQPFSTQRDGDVLYAVTTSEIDNEELSSVDLGVVASELAWDAVLSSVPELSPLPAVSGESLPRDLLAGYAGTYEFADGGRLEVAIDRGSVTATFSKGLVEQNLYFDEGVSYGLSPAGERLFIIEGAARDTLRFEGDGSDVTEVTLNPGRWAITAARRP